ncbi:SH3 domain-binding protein 5 [Fukomys damarensis]|uniref:SH3 domain-binding protein 5 n=1 Tax=Fukomys damarensis TaxID=885580 RepID=A0A091CR44_FUKDA|nr:SH3 domain-binding protein 5 [Fukomys damarensis]
MQQLEKKLKRAISKSKPYFEPKVKYYIQLEQLKKTVDDLQATLTLAKGEYKTALKTLERISDEIHEGSAPVPWGLGAVAWEPRAAARLWRTCPEADLSRTQFLWPQRLLKTTAVATLCLKMAQKVSLCLASEFGMMFPVLGPWSECSSPECEKNEGAENKTSDKANNNRGLSNSGGGGRGPKPAKVKTGLLDQLLVITQQHDNNYLN